MLKEIYEQPSSVEATLQELYPDVEKIGKAPDIQSAGMIYFTGSGTSYHACLAAHYALSRLSGRFASTLPASEFSNWVREDRASKPIMVAISQSGESVDVLNAVRIAMRARIKVIGITNSPRSTLTEIADFSLVSKAGRERALAATKSFTSTLAAAYMVAMQLAKREMAESMFRKLNSILRGIHKHLESTIARSDLLAEKLAGSLRHKELFFVLGSGAGYPTALEGALKLKECCNVHAEGFATREFLHGPMQLVDKRTPVIIIRNEDDMDETSRLVGSFMRFDAPTLVIQASDRQPPGSLRLGAVHGDAGVFSTLTNVVPLQLFAYYSSTARGLNPDKPRKLSKVVK